MEWAKTLMMNSFTAPIRMILLLFHYLPPTVSWTKSGKSPPTIGQGASAPDVAIRPVASAASSLSSRIVPLITQYQTKTDDSEFTSFLADFQRALN
jgi:hypothetical protein